MGVGLEKLSMSAFLEWENAQETRRVESLMRGADGGGLRGPGGWRRLTGAAIPARRRKRVAD